MDVDAVHLPQPNASAEKQNLFGLCRLASKLGFSQNEIKELRRTYGAAFELGQVRTEVGRRKGSAPK